MEKEAVTGKPSDDDQDDANTTGSAAGNVEADAASGGAPEPA